MKRFFTAGMVLQCIVFFIIIQCEARAQRITNKTILITAPKGYSERMQKVFTEKSFNVIASPFIQTTVPVNIKGDVKSFLNRIVTYDYVMFSSRKAVDALFQGLKAANIAPSILRGIKLCAIGKDADYVFEKLHVRASIIPKEPSPMGIADEIFQQGDAKGKTIAVLAPEVLGIKEPPVVPDFIDKLKSMGMEVTRVNVYTTQAADIEASIALIKLKKIDCIAFTSSAEIEVLLSRIGKSMVLKDIDIACFGIYTAAFAKEKGLNVKIISKDFSSFNGFADAVYMFYNNR